MRLVGERGSALGLLLALLVLAPGPAAADWTARLRPRVELGPSVGVLPARYSFGFHALGELQLATWRHGEVGVGALFAVHFTPVQIDELRSLELSALDTSIGLAPTIGHTFRFFSRRLSLSVQIYTGLRVRTTRSSLEDPGHGISVSHSHAAVFWEAGCAVWAGWQISEHWGIRAGGAMPVLLTKESDLLLLWHYSPAYLGLSGTYYF